MKKYMVPQNDARPHGTSRNGAHTGARQHQPHGHRPHGWSYAHIVDGRCKHSR